MALPAAGGRAGGEARVPNLGPLPEAAEAQAFPPGAAGLRHRGFWMHPTPAMTVVPDPDVPRLRRQKKGWRRRGF